MHYTEVGGIIRVADRQLGCDISSFYIILLQSHRGDEVGAGLVTHTLSVSIKLPPIRTAGGSNVGCLTLNFSFFPLFILAGTPKGATSTKLLKENLFLNF